MEKDGMEKEKNMMIMVNYYLMEYIYIKINWLEKEKNMIDMVN